MTEDGPEPVDMAGPDEPTIELPTVYLPAKGERRRITLGLRIRLEAIGPGGRPYWLLAALGAVVGILGLWALIRAL